MAVLDEGDVALRASRGNFALDLGAEQGARHARVLALDAALGERLGRVRRRTQGADRHRRRLRAARRLPCHAVRAARWQYRDAADEATALRSPACPPIEYEMLDHDARQSDAAADRPGRGGRQLSAPLDGQCNSLRLFRALNQAMQQLGATYLPNHIVDRVDTGRRRLSLFTRPAARCVPKRSCSPPASAMRDSRRWWA